MLELARIKQIVEAAVLCADEPLTVEALERLFADGECDKATLRAALDSLEQDAAERGVELRRVASGYRYQVRQDLAQWMSRLWEDRPPRYSRALLETLALIAYKQPVTRGDIEQVRGVTVNSNMVRTLLERDWIRVVGYREVPGRPAMYGTTKVFLDYFNLKSLDELPTLDAIKALIEPSEAELAYAGPEYVEGPRVEFPGDAADVVDDTVESPNAAAVPGAGDR
jgi:segregation and condensation protein B